MFSRRLSNVMTRLSTRLPSTTIVPASCATRLPTRADRLGLYIPKPYGGGTVPKRMFSIQADLPRLPVPALNQTLEKYIRAVRPFVNDEEFNRTKQLASELQSGVGPELQSLLESKAAVSDNWLSQWWLEQAYLRYRESVVINVSPGVVLPLKEFNSVEAQASWAARLLAGVLDYKLQIDQQTLPVEKLGGQPLCMMQYYKILNSCRVPRDEMDEVTCFPPDQPGAPKHVVVVHNGHFFELPVYGSDSQPLSRQQLTQAFKSIMTSSASRAENPVGVLTSGHRDTWTKQQAVLESLNQSTIDSIRRSILVVCLDSALGDSTSLTERLATACSTMLHGNGINSSNRWFDKTLQLIITRDGASGVCYEHAPAEGPPVMALIDHMINHANDDAVPQTDAADTSEAKRLEFNVPEEISRQIPEAQTIIEQAGQNVSMNVLQFTDFGKNFPKTQRLSPDAFIQVAIQLAYFRLHGRACASYESGSLRRFQLGRTDTIRGCSEASVEFTRVMQDASTGTNERAEKLKAAINAHREYTNATIVGQAIDRHLLGLKLTAVENDITTPRLLTDEVYQRAVHFNISTSQVPARSACLLCFGPVVPDGYGICYNPQEHQLLFSVTTYNADPTTSSQRMSQALHAALNDMRLVLEPPKAKL